MSSRNRRIRPRPRDPAPISSRKNFSCTIGQSFPGIRAGERRDARDAPHAGTRGDPSRHVGRPAISERLYQIWVSRTSARDAEVVGCGDCVIFDARPRPTRRSSLHLCFGQSGGLACVHACRQTRRHRSRNCFRRMMECRQRERLAAILTNHIAR